MTRCGYHVITAPAQRIYPDDILIIWNRSPAFDIEARRHIATGSRVIVAENGYLDAVDERGHQLFSLALDHHNGAGRWFVGAEPRFPLLQTVLQPWRTSGGHILVLPQRGIGAPGVCMPRSWSFDVRKRLARLTSRPVHVREHPGLKSVARRGRPLAADLDGAHAAVVWASGAGLKALAAGVPVFYDMSEWIGAWAAGQLAPNTNLENPFMDDTKRAAMFERLAWCQWSVADITSGKALRWLLSEGKL